MDSARPPITAARTASNASRRRIWIMLGILILVVLIVFGSAAVSNAIERQKRLNYCLLYAPSPDDYDLSTAAAVCEVPEGGYYGAAATEYYFGNAPYISSVAFQTDTRTGAELCHIYHAWNDAYYSYRDGELVSVLVGGYDYDGALDANVPHWFLPGYTAQ